MKRLFTLLAALMLIFAVSFAQQNFYFWSKRGGVDKYSQVDSLTFSVGSWLFLIDKPVNIGVTNHAFQGSAKVSFNEKVKSIKGNLEVGICYSDKNSMPTYNDFKKKLSYAMQDSSFMIMKLASGTTYYYRTYVKYLEDVYYSDVSSFNTKDEEPQGYTINGYKYVDLGLPSGLLWAETNVGAASSTGYGDYFAWGDTGDYYFDPFNLDVIGYPFTLDSEYDAATVNWGTPWRMPSLSEFTELYNKCDWSWQGNGYLVTGPNGNTIFFPASRIRGTGFYWSRSRDFDCVATEASGLFFSSDYVAPSRREVRYDKYPVRPVAKK